MAITKEQAIDILERFDFFQGQRAGRELWNEKSRYVQEIDLRAFQEDVALLREYIADVVPKSEVAREIILEIDTLICCHANGDIDDKRLYMLLDELKKKYTEGK